MTCTRPASTPGHTCTTWACTSSATAGSTSGRYGRGASAGSRRGGERGRREGPRLARGDQRGLQGREGMTGSVTTHTCMVQVAGMNIDSTDEVNGWVLCVLLLPTQVTQGWCCGCVGSWQRGPHLSHTHTSCERWLRFHAGLSPLPKCSRCVAQAVPFRLIAFPAGSVAGVCDNALAPTPSEPAGAAAASP